MILIPKLNRFSARAGHQYEPDYRSTSLSLSLKRVDIILRKILALEPEFSYGIFFINEVTSSDPVGSEECNRAGAVTSYFY
jgi:hypothetical protein